MFIMLQYYVWEMILPKYILQIYLEKLSLLMSKRKVETKQVEPYVPKPDTQIYVYIQKSQNRLTPVPYKSKPNNQNLKELLYKK